MNHQAWLESPYAEQDRADAEFQANLSARRISILADLASAKDAEAALLALDDSSVFDDACLTVADLARVLLDPYTSHDVRCKRAMVILSDRAEQAARWAVERGK